MATFFNEVEEKLLAEKAKTIGLTVHDLVLLTVVAAKVETELEAARNLIDRLISERSKTKLELLEYLFGKKEDLIKLLEEKIFEA